MRGRDRDLAKRVARQVLWVITTWDTVAIAVAGFFIFFASSAMAPVSHSHDTAGVLAVIVISGAFALALLFTWVRPRRILDLLWPLPRMPQRDSESPSLQMKL